MSDTSKAAARIKALLDAGSFVEIGGQVTARSTDFNLNAEKTPSDGVVTGYGTIDGNLIYIYSQDASVLGGSIGEMHAKKISRIYSLAMKTGAPVIGLLDSTGVRLEEAADALDSLGRVLAKMSFASGLIPQITAVFGPCGGALSFIPALSDFTFIESENGKLFVNSPDAISGNTTEACDTSSPSFQMEAGNADFAGTEAEGYAGIRELVTFLPINNEDEGDGGYSEDDLNRSCTGFASYTDPRDQLRVISDNAAFFETKRGYADNMVTGFIRLNGFTVGAVANNKTELCAKGMEKAAKFIGFCDAFNIPVLTLVNATSLHACECGEKLHPKNGAALACAYASATVPKVSVISGKAFGSAYILMGSKAMGADMVYAFETSEIGTMDPKMAAKIISAGEDADTMKKTAEEYKALQNSVLGAARHGLVDTIISDADTRKYVIGAFEMLYTKREERPDKKHVSF